MRLLNTNTLQLEEFFGSTFTIPYYAILSHRWEEEEVTYQDFREGRRSEMAGWSKILGCCRQAAMDGFEHVWIDTCCIDKSSSAELSEAINSMFKWYQKSKVCYVYLSDVDSADGNLHNANSSFRNSKWFTRGWTLQELIAPEQVEFYDKHWMDLGTKSGLHELIKKITGITHLFDYGRASVAQKMSWASKRETTRPEDEAYCLLGIFDVNMPLLYGEGSKAFLRLQTEILSKTDDESVFAWPRRGRLSTGLLAECPREFSDCGNVVRVDFDLDKHPMYMTSRGICLELHPLEPTATERGTYSRIEMTWLPLNCSYRTKKSPKPEYNTHQLALLLKKEFKNGIWEVERLAKIQRDRVTQHTWIPSMLPSMLQRSMRRIYIPQVPSEGRSLTHNLGSKTLIHYPNLQQRDIHITRRSATSEAASWTDIAPGRVMFSPGRPIHFCRALLQYTSSYRGWSFMVMIESTSSRDQEFRTVDLAVSTEEMKFAEHWVKEIRILKKMGKDRVSCYLNDGGDSFYSINLSVKQQIFQNFPTWVIILSVEENGRLLWPRGAKESFFDV